MISAREYDKVNKKFQVSCEALEHVLEEEGFGESSVVSCWTSPKGKYFKIVFQSEKCPFCLRKHERPQAFWSQYFNPPENKLRYDDLLEPPAAFLGCFREPGQSESSRFIGFAPHACIVYDGIRMHAMKRVKDSSHTLTPRALELLNGVVKTVKRVKKE